MMLLKLTAGDSFQRKFCTGADDLAVLDQEQAVARHAGVEQRHAGRPAGCTRRTMTSRPRLVDLIISSTVAVPPSITRLMFGVVPVGVLLLLLRPEAVVEEVLDDALLDPGDALRGQAVLADRRLAQDRVADLAAQREVVAEHLLAEPRLRRAPCRS